MDDDIYLSTKIDENRSLCISAISRKTFEECGAEYFSTDHGFFIYERDSRMNRGGISILGKVASLDAAYRFFDLIRAAVPTNTQYSA